MTELIDAHLGAYQLVEIMGRGGMSIVYKAYQSTLERFVAVKVLLHSSDPLFTARFKREALSIAQLQHPNILPIFDFGEQHGRFYLVMPCVENGTTLADMLGRPMEPVRALRLIKNVLAALDYAHARGIVHRDIKPGNVLMPSPTWPMLADFGIAKLMSDGMRLTMSGTIIGTAAYMAPEQATGEHVDARADLYATGIMLYELLTGRVPFEADTPIAMLLKHTRTPPPPPRQFNGDVPAIVEEAVLRALEKNPNDRYQSAAEMAEVLDQVAAQLERDVAPSKTNGAEHSQSRSVGEMAGAPLPPLPPVIPSTASDQRAELYQNGLREFRAGHWTQALEYLNRLIAIDPIYEDAPRLLRQIQAAQAYAQTDQQRRAASTPTASQAQSGPAELLTATCPKCGQPTQLGWTVCPVCKTSLTAPKKTAGVTLKGSAAGDAPSRRNLLFWALPLAALVVVAIGLWALFGRGSGTPTPQPTSVPTIQEAFIAPVAATDAPATSAPTDAPATSAPTAAPATSAPTDAPTSPPSATATEAPSATPLPDAQISANNMNLRAGPSTLFPSLGVYGQNTPLEVLGRTNDGAWLKVRTPDTREGWMLATNLLVNMPAAEIQVVEAPPIPTLTPVPTRRPRPTATPAPAAPPAAPVEQPTAPPQPAEPPPAQPPGPEPPTATPDNNGGNNGGRPAPTKQQQDPTKPPRDPTKPPRDPTKPPK